MPSLPIVEDLDVVEDGIGELEAGPPPLAIQEFDLHARPEAFHHRVIKRVADRSEGGHESRRSHLLGEGPGGELDSVVGVNYRSVLGPTLPDSHVEGVHDELGVLNRVDGPADDPSAAGVARSSKRPCPRAFRRVMSVTQSSLSPSRLNWRSTRSSLVGTLACNFSCVSRVDVNGPYA